jgi:hypothetical protein
MLVTQASASVGCAPTRAGLPCGSAASTANLRRDRNGAGDCTRATSASGITLTSTVHRRHCIERDACRRAAREIYTEPAHGRWLADPAGPAGGSFHAWRRHAFSSCSLSSLAGWPKLPLSASPNAVWRSVIWPTQRPSACWHRQHACGPARPRRPSWAASAWEPGPSGAGTAPFTWAGRVHLIAGKRRCIGVSRAWGVGRM